MKTHFFFRRVGIQLPSDRFEAIDDVVRFAFLSSFESHVLPKVREALLVWLLVPTTNVEHNPPVSDLGMWYLFVYNTDAIRQGV